MELKDLVGSHKLDAVDFSEASIKTWDDTFEDCQVCRFRVDGVAYVAVENPEDGYRSSMRDLGVDEKAEMKNTFAAIDIVARHRTDGEYGDEDDVLEIINASSGKIILEVGTESTDDYYPGYIARFHPENIGELA
jgi:hypothetical protein